MKYELSRSQVTVQVGSGLHYNRGEGNLRKEIDCSKLNMAALLDQPWWLLKAISGRKKMGPVFDI